MAAKIMKQFKFRADYIWYLFLKKAKLYIFLPLTNGVKTRTNFLRFNWSIPILWNDLYTKVGKDLITTFRYWIPVLIFIYRSVCSKKQNCLRSWNEFISSLLKEKNFHKYKYVLIEAHLKYLSKECFTNKTDFLRFVINKNHKEKYRFLMYTSWNIYLNEESSVVKWYYHI